MLICGSSCAEDSEKEYKKQSKGTGDCKKTCPKDKEEDGGECEKNCKSLGMLSLSKLSPSKLVKTLTECKC